jgi:hypothetical protein
MSRHKKKAKAKIKNWKRQIKAMRRSEQDNHKRSVQPMLDAIDPIMTEVLLEHGHFKLFNRLPPKPTAGEPEQFKGLTHGIQGRSGDFVIIDDPAANQTPEQQERIEKWYHDLPRFQARREAKRNMEWLRALRIPIPSELADHIPGFIKEPMTMDEVHTSLGGFSRKRSTENVTIKDGIIARLREITEERRCAIWKQQQEIAILNEEIETTKQALASMEQLYWQMERTAS